MKEFAKSLGKVAKSAGDAAARTLRTKVEEAQDQERPGDLGGLAACAGTSAGELPDSVTVMVGCWNVFASAISDDDGLDEWLLAGGACGPPDVLALGFQEVIDLHPANCVLKMGGDYEREDLIDAKLTSYLQKHGKYVKARSVGMIGLYLVCFVKESIAPHVSQVDADRVKGHGEGMVGKKGAVAVRFEVAGRPMCFVNMHLPSGQQRDLERRSSLEQVLWEVFRRTNVLGGRRPPKLGFRRDAPRGLAERPTEAGPEGGDAGAAFLCGDFNFRLSLAQKDLPVGAPRLDPEAVMALRAFDPSQQGATAEPVLSTFKEGAIDFAPTYKYKVGTDEFDEIRVPAWTDRIFFRGDCVEQLHYGSHPALRHTADHRPVSALFVVAMPPRPDGAAA